MNAPLVDHLLFRLKRRPFPPSVAAPVRLTFTLFLLAASVIMFTAAQSAPNLNPLAPYPATAESVICLPLVYKPHPPLWFYTAAITIPTYGYENGFYATGPEDPVYPYPRLDFTLVGPKALRVYQAVVMENSYVAITILPELGGRLYRWVDKTTGRHLLYENPVVKPTGWGHRGWWLSAGGIEWAFPVDEHGLNEWRPWNYQITAQSDRLSITVSDVESRTGMLVGATISLDAYHSYVELEPWAVNNTGQTHAYQLWLNGMVTLGGRHVSGETEFILPVDQVVVHSTGDGDLPPEGSWMSWPVYNGRDMSRYYNWRHYLGFFIPTAADSFTGMYDHEAGQGIARVYEADGPVGGKIFAPATLPPSLWTDDDSNYVELWSGATPTFWNYAYLSPGERVGWKEYWYPVNGLGSFHTANRQAALRLAVTAATVEVGAAVTSPFTGHLALWQNGVLAATWPLSLSPGDHFQASWVRPLGAAGPFSLTLTAGDQADLDATTRLDS